MKEGSISFPVEGSMAFTDSVPPAASLNPSIEFPLI